MSTVQQTDSNIVPAPSFDPTTIVVDGGRIDDNEATSNEVVITFTLAETVDQEAMGYRAWKTPVGDFLARQMETLAQMIRWTGATTPDEHEARIEVWDDEIREQWEARGYEEGKMSCRCRE